jgi:Uma2 family endonuclease
MEHVVQREIILPETQPETEWLRGRAVQKVSPKRRHGELQVWLAWRLTTWARGRGRVASEWRFRVAPAGEVVRPLVPDISYLSYDRMRGKAASEWDTPLGAPEVAVEIRSPDDRAADLADKVATLLRAGTSVVFVIDTDERTVEVHDAAGTDTLAAFGTLEHAALPGFSVDLTEMFDALELDEPR